MYASRTGTRRNLAAFRLANWRILVSMSGAWRTEGFPYCLDNGAWSCHTQGIEWDAVRFVEYIEKLGSGADFIIAPDIVGGGLESLRLTESWLSRLPGLRLVAVQDGMTPGDVAPLLSESVGIAVGGSTEWKLSTLHQWGELASLHGCYLHVLRVNSAKRMALCVAAGADSCDGTSGTRFAVNVPKLEAARSYIVAQTQLFELGA